MSNSNAPLRGANPFVPLLLLALTVLILVGFQASQSYRDRENLEQLHAGQDQPLAEARKLRAQLDGVAADTARLAQQGNANAQRVIEQLAKRGITINPERATPVDHPPP